MQQWVIATLRSSRPLPTLSKDFGATDRLAPTLLIEADSKCCAFQRLTSAGSALKITAAHQTLMRGHYETYYIFVRPSSLPQRLPQPHFFKFSPSSTCRPTSSLSQTAVSSCCVRPDTLYAKKYSGALPETAAFKNSASPLPPSLLFSSPPFPLQSSTSSSLTSNLCLHSLSCPGRPLKAALIYSFCCLFLPLFLPLLPPLLPQSVPAHSVLLLPAVQRPPHADNGHSVRASSTIVHL